MKEKETETQIQLKKLFHFICSKNNVDIEQMYKRTKNNRDVLIRQQYLYIAYNRITHNFEDIGKAIKRSRSNCYLTYTRTIKGLFDTYKDYRIEIRKLEREFFEKEIEVEKVEEFKKVEITERGELLCINDKYNFCLPNEFISEINGYTPTEIELKIKLKKEK